MTLHPGVQFSGVATPCASVVCNASKSLTNSFVRELYEHRNLVLVR